MCKKIQWSIWAYCQKRPKHGMLQVEDKCPKYRKGARGTGSDDWCPDFNGGRSMGYGEIYDPYCAKCDKTWKEAPEKKSSTKPYPVTPSPNPQVQERMSRFDRDKVKAAEPGTEQRHLAPQRALSYNRPANVISDGASAFRSHTPPRRPANNPIFPRAVADEDVEMRDYSDSDIPAQGNSSDVEMDTDTPKDYSRWR